MEKQRGDRASHDYFYDPYGGIIDDNGHPEDSSNWTDPHNHHLRAHRRPFDGFGDSFGARYYDAANGVWLTQDVYRGQVEQPLTLHRTLYVLAGQISNFAYLWVNVQVGRAKNPDVTRFSALTSDLGRAQAAYDTAGWLISDVQTRAQEEPQRWSQP